MVSKSYNQLETPLKYLSKISPAVNTLNYVARTQKPRFLDYLPGSTSLQSTYQPMQKLAEKITNHNAALMSMLQNKNTTALLSAIGTTSSLISCGAPAILIMGGSLIAATTT